MQAAHQKLLQDVKRTVLELDSEAEVILFGSRARGDAREDSDWDFLVLTEKAATEKFKRQIRDALYDVELDALQVITTLIYNKSEWEERDVTLLFRNIEREGVGV